MTISQSIYLVLMLVCMGLISIFIGGNLLASWGFSVMWFMYCCASVIVGELKNLKDK